MLRSIALVLLICPSAVGQFQAGVQVDNKGFSPSIEYRQEFKEKCWGDSITFGPRLGYNWLVFGEYDHFYLQQVIKYKGFVFSPFWLRSYSKQIGYQVPTSIGYEHKNLSLWINYVYHARLFDAHLRYTIKKL